MADITGTAGNDALPGTPGDDEIDALAGSDTVNAGAGNDDVRGGPGNDALHGEAGNDTLVDAFNQSAGPDENDKLFGEAGNDVLISFQAGHFNDIDELRGGDGDDIVNFNGAQTGDVADGGPGIDTFGGDFASGAAGSIRMDFSAGNFAVFVDDVSTVSAIGFEALNMVVGGGADFIIGSARNDAILSSGGVDTLHGLGGDDELGFVGFGEVTLTGGISVAGGAGTDTLLLLTGLANASYVFDVAAGVYTRNGAAVGISNFERLHLGLNTQGSVRAVGGALSDSIATGFGNDTVNGGGGDDFIAAPFADNAPAGGTKLIDAGAGDDRVSLGRFGTSTASGGAGVDTLVLEEERSGWTLETAGTARLVSALPGGGTIIPTGFELFEFDFDLFTAAEIGFGGGVSGGAGNDALAGTGARDIISGLAGDDTLDGGAGIDFLAGGAGVDVASAAGSTSLVFVERTNNVGGFAYFFDGASFDQTTNIEGAIGGSAGDFLLGNSQGNLFRGGGGRDAILGRGRSDTLEGGDGDDLLMGGNSYDPAENIFGDPGNDSIDGGAGSDTIFGQGDRDTIHGGDGVDYILGGVGVNFQISGIPEDRIDGGAGDDFLFGGSAFVFNQANAGPDVIAGGDGLDFIVGGQQADTLSGDGGDDLVYAGAGNDLINNGAGVDLAAAGAGNDSLFGETGNDTIAGGSGFDYVYGGAGADTFLFQRGDSFDSIFDWSIAEGDKLKLDAALGIAGFNDFKARLTGFAFEGADYTVLALATTVGGVTQFDQLTIKGIRPDQWTEAMLA